MKTIQMPENSHVVSDREGLTDEAGWMNVEDNCPEYGDMDSDGDALFIKGK